MPQVIVDSISRFYASSKVAVSVGNKLSATFQISSGVLQGDVLAPYLFIIVIDFVMSRSQRNFGFIYKKRTSQRYPDEVISDLDYADDIALLVTTIKTAFLSRRSAAWSAYWKLEKIWKAMQIPVKLRAGARNFSSMWQGGSLPPPTYR